MTGRTLRLGDDAPFHRLVGVGGIGTGMFLALEGDRTLGRSESRPARLLEARDYCKLHIVEHYVSVLLGPDRFPVVAIGAVGDDEPGRRLLGEMTEAGIDVQRVAIEPRPTLFSVCFLYPDGEGGNITTSDSAASALRPEDLEVVRPLLDARTIALAAPEVPLGSRARLLELATEAGSLRVASFTSSEVALARSSGLFERVDLVSLNQDEAQALAARPFDPEDPTPFLERCATALADARPGIRIVLSAGGRGAFVFHEGRWWHREIVPAEVVATSGAGDALLAGILVGLAAGIPLTLDASPSVLASALDLGVLLAGYSVTSPHTIHPGADAEALMTYAAEAGLRFGPPLSGVLPTSTPSGR